MLTTFVRPSVNIFQLENHWKGFGDIWSGRYAIGIYLKPIYFNFRQSVIPKLRTEELVTWERTSAT
jgi:hypothetical protein